MFSRVPERRFRLIRTGLLTAWLVLIGSLLWDPLTPMLTDPANLASPFHLGAASAVVQGHALDAVPYPMGARIFWTMVLPLVPLALMVFGHESWRRVCPLSHASQIPARLGWQRRRRAFNRATGRVDRLLPLLAGRSWMARNHILFQFGFLSVGVLGRLLFYNSDRIALAIAFIVVLGSAMTVGFLYGGKTWCNYVCPVSVIQTIYTGPGGLFDSKAHTSSSTTPQSMCRTPGVGGGADQSSCVGCATHCPDVDLEHAYWERIEPWQMRIVYYGFFGLVFAFYTYYYVYAGNWSYYMSGAWTHERGQLATLFNDGFYLFGTGIPVPKLVAAPLYFAACIAISYALFMAAERAWGRIAAWRGTPVSEPRLRHAMLMISAFLSINLFYTFAGRPNLLLLPSWVVRGIDTLVVVVSVVWLFRALGRDASLYRRERVARTLRAQLVRMGFRPEDGIDGGSIEQLSADQVYVLAKTLPNFSVARRREAYSAVLADLLETGRMKSADSARMLADLRAQLTLSDADHHAVIAALGVQDPGLLDPGAGRSAERRVRHQNYRRFLRDHLHAGGSGGATEVLKPARAQFNISDDDHAHIVGEVTDNQTALTERADRLLAALCRLEADRFSLGFDQRAEAQLLRRALLLQQKVLIGEITTAINAAADPRVAAAWAQAIHVIAGTGAQDAVADAAARAPDAAHDAFWRVTPDPVARSYLDVIEAARPAQTVLRDLMTHSDPVLAALAAAALVLDGADDAAAIAAAIAAAPGARAEKSSVLADDIRTSLMRGERADLVAVMGTLLEAKVFSGLDLALLLQLAQHAVRVAFAAGERICREGEGPDSLFILVEGEARAWTDGEQGDLDLGLVELGLRGPGAVFGSLDVLAGRPRVYSVEVTSAFATLVAVPRDVVEDVLSRDAQATRGMLAAISRVVRDGMITAPKAGSAAARGITRPAGAGAGAGAGVAVAGA